MKKRILVISSTFPRSEEDKQIPWMGELLRRLRSKGLDIEVFAPAHRGSPSHNYFGIPVYRFRYAPASLETLTHDEGAIFKLRRQPWLFFLPPFYLFFGLISLIRITKQKRYDFIHIHWPFPQGILGLAAKWLTRSKLILTFYGAEFALTKKIPFGKTILRMVIKNADRITAISNFTERKIQDIQSVPVKVIPFVSGISKTRFLKLKSRKKENQTKRILFVGRLIERKGVIYLIKAMPKILSSTPARLDIVGGGSLFSQLEKEIHRLQLQRQIFLHGRVSEEELITFYKNCDVFVLPAIVDKWGDTEGLGVVLLEAMSFKKPVIGSKIGGITDIIKNNQTGILVPQKSSSALAKAITRVLKDQKLANKLADSGYRFVQLNFNWEKIIDQTLKLYH